MENSSLDRWAVPLLSVLGTLGLAGWCIYWDLRRRLAPRRAADAPPLLPETETSASKSWILDAAIGSLAAAWLMRYLSDRWGGWLALAGYGAFIAGIVLLAVHVGRRLSEQSRGPGAG